MKRKSNLLKVFNNLLSSLLALLGYTSCDSSEDIPVEYGTPYAKYEVKGKVVDKESQATIEGARVIVKPVISNDGAEQTFSYTMTRFILTKTENIFIRKKWQHTIIYVWYVKIHQERMKPTLPY